MLDPLAGAQPVPDPLADAQPLQGGGGLPAPYQGPQPQTVPPTGGGGLPAAPATNGAAALMDALKSKAAAVGTWADQKGTPWGIEGMTAEQYNALPLAERAKVTLKAMLKAGGDIGTVGLRVAAKTAQGAVKGIGGIGGGTVTGAEKLGAFLSGTSPQELAVMQQSGQVTNPADIAQATSNLASHLNFSNDPTSALNQPQTALGQVLDPIGEMGTWLLGGEAVKGAELGGAGTRMLLGTGLGAQGFGSGYQQAMEQNAPNPIQHGLAAGAINAAMGVMPTTEAGEPIIAKMLGKAGANDLTQKIGAKIGTTLTQAEAFTVVQNAINKSIDPKTGYFDQKQLLSNLAQVGGAKLFGTLMNAQVDASNRQQPLPEWITGRQMPGQTAAFAKPSDVETNYLNLQSQRLGDQALANAHTNALKGYSPEANRDVSLYLSDLEAGLTPKPLTPEGEKLLNDPAFQNLRQGLAQRYQESQTLSGGGEQANPNYLPRVVTEAPDTAPTISGQGGKLAQTAANLKARSVQAFVGPDGNPVVGLQTGRSIFMAPALGEDGNTIRRVSLDDHLQDIKNARDYFNSQLANLGLGKANDYFQNVYNEVQKKVNAVTNLEKQISDIPQDTETGFPHDPGEAARFQRLTQKLSIAHEEAAQGLQAMLGATLLDPAKLGAGLMVNDPKAQAMASIVDDMNNRVNEAYGRYANDAGNLYTDGKNLYTKRDASIREIEAQTPIRYRANATQDAIEGLVGMGTANRNMQFLQTLKGSGLVAQDGQETPKGFTQLTGQAANKFPALAQVKMDPRVAAIFEDAADQPAPKIPATGAIDKVFRSLIGLPSKLINFSFMGNPVAHTPNQLDHGLNSLTPDEWVKGISSGDLFRAANDASAANRSVQQGNPNPDAIRYMQAGGVVTQGRLISNAYQQGKAAVEPSINEQARMALGQAYDPLSQPGMTPLSQKYTWGPDDTTRMWLAFTKEAVNKIPLADAIQEVNKTYPTYRNPVNRIDTAPVPSQWLHEFANWPGALFMRYRLAADGILGSNILNTINPDILGQGGTRTGSAIKLAQKAATGTALAAIIGALARESTQNPQLGYSGGGSMHIANQFGKDVQEGPVGAAKFVAQQAIPDPALNLYMTLQRGGFNGQQMVNPADAHDAVLALKRGDMGTAYRHLQNYSWDAAKGLANAGLYSSGVASDALMGRKPVPDALARMFLRASTDSTDAEAMASQIIRARMPKLPPDANSVAASNDKMAYATALRNQDPDAMEQVMSNGNLDEKAVSKLIGRYAGGDRTKALAAQVQSLPVADAARVFAYGSPEEKQALYPIVAEKISKALDRLKTPQQVLNFREANAQRLQGLASMPTPEDVDEAERIFTLAGQGLHEPVVDPLATAKPVAPSTK